MRIRNLHVLIVVCVMYAAAQMLADITSLRGLAIAGLSFNAFTLVYPLTFTLRDMAHKLAGPNVARTIIITSALIYLLTQGFFWLISQLPPEMTAEEQTVLGELLQTDWRFLLAAVAATVASQLLDTELYTWWKKRYGQRKQWGAGAVEQCHQHPGRPASVFAFGFRRSDVAGGDGAAVCDGDGGAACRWAYLDSRHLSGRRTLERLAFHGRGQTSGLIDGVSVG